MSISFPSGAKVVAGRAAETAPFKALTEQDIALVLGAALVCIVLVALLWRGPRRRWIVVDGSNVLYWKDNTPSIASVVIVVDALRLRGFDPVVWFDANVGYLVGGRYLGPHALARRLRLPERQVMVAPKGMPADPLLLEGAARLRTRVVSNDRFRDWTDAHPQIRDAGFLVPGRLEAGRASLSLPD